MGLQSVQSVVQQPLLRSHFKRTSGFGEGIRVEVVTPTAGSTATPWKRTLEDRNVVTTTIKLQNFASYSPTESTTLTLTKPVAVLYGHNGAGKSTIAKVIRHHINATLGSAGSCSVTVNGLTEPEFLIYDTEYVEENFHTKEGKGIRGIFTLGKKTAEELEEIERLEDDTRRISTELESASVAQSQLDSDLEKTFNSTKDATWVIKSDYEKGPLRFCLEENKVRGDKARLFQHLSKAEDADGSILIEDLLREASEIEDETAEKKVELSVPANSISSLESNHLLGSVIAGSSDSRLSALIATLKNESWVRGGQEHVHNSNGTCPFCQQALPHDFSPELAKLFDTAYEDQCQQLSTLRDEYKSSVAVLASLAASAPYQDEYVSSDLALQNAWKDLFLVLEQNSMELEKKVGNPGDPVTLTDSTKAFDAWSALAATAAAKIINYNNRISNRDQVRKSIDKRFWQRMRHDHSASISLYKNQAASVTSQKSILAESVTSLNADLAKKNESLRELRASSTNIDASIYAINQRIQNIGIQGFKIERDTKNDGYYHIARGSKGKIDYTSLSEGEKNLVTFLYFIELLEGSHKSDGNSNKSNRIIVIDDPVSSLSHNHVYDIASLITINIIERGKFPQVIVLTHSLFFYHEIFKAAQVKDWKNYQCFRVTKKDFSKVCEMRHDEIKNDYQSYWLVLKEGISSHKYSVAIPIAMRYILEHYFSFIGYHDKLRGALIGLVDDDKPFHAFYRYINRQSHSDDINISDLPEIDPSIYVEKFRQVFDKTGYLRHFNHMMGIEGTEVSSPQITGPVSK